MKAALLALLCLGLASSGYATLGVDLASYVSTSSWKCIRSSGRSFAIVRGWHSYGSFDANVVSTVANAWAGGMAHVDVYMFPCRGKSASSQVDGLISSLSSHGVKYGMIWFDIETNPSSGCGWGSNHAANCDYMKQLLAAAAKHGKKVGVYASTYMWSSIMGSCTAAAHVPLWYAHYDASASFSDYRSFGGWSKPAIKQYSGTGSICGVGVDLNYY